MQSVAAIRDVMFASRSPRSMRQDPPWDVGLDRLAEQANPPRVPRRWWVRASDSVSRLAPSWFPVRRDKLRDAPCLGVWDPTPRAGRFVLGWVRGRKEERGCLTGTFRGEPNLLHRSPLIAAQRRGRGRLCWFAPAAWPAWWRSSWRSAGGVLTDAQLSTLGAILAAIPLLLLVPWLAAIRAFQATTLGRLGSAGAVGGDGRSDRDRRPQDPSGGGSH